MAVLVGAFGILMVRRSLWVDPAVPQPITQNEKAIEVLFANDTVVVDRVPTPIAVSPLVVTGKARGTFFFEGTFPVMLVNWDGLIIGEGYATADSEWMTTDFVPFTASIAFTEGAHVYSRGILIVQNANPSGEPERSIVYEIPVTLATQ